MSNIDEVTFDGRGDRHRRRHQMGSPACALTAFKISIAGGSATFPWLQDVGIHGQTHAASSLSPFESCFTKYVIKAFRLSMLFDESGPWDHHGMHRLGNSFPLGKAGCQPEVFNS